MNASDVNTTFGQNLLRVHGTSPCDIFLEGFKPEGTVGGNCPLQCSHVGINCKGTWQKLWANGIILSLCGFPEVKRMK